jgi:hypothetical protein
MGMSCAYGKVNRLRCGCDVKSLIQLFVEWKGKTFPLVGDYHWKCDSGFCVEIAEHWNELNINQPMYKICITFLMKSLIKVTALGRRLWELQLQLGDI